HDRKMDGWWRSCGSRLVQTYRGDVPPMGRVEGMDLVGFFSQTSDDPCGHAGVDLLGTTIFACKRPRREVASAGGAYPDASGCAITAGIAAHTYTWDVGWRRARLCAPEAQFTQGLPLTTTNPSQAGRPSRAAGSAGPAGAGPPLQRISRPGGQPAATPRSGHENGNYRAVAASIALDGSAAAEPRSTCPIVPCLSITKVTRLAMRKMPSAPYCRDTARFWSERNGNAAPSFARKPLFVSGLFMLTASSCVFDLSSSARP